jgi:protein-tyrosine phosphatase
VNTSYGSMYNYAVHGLGLSPATIAKLQAKFLEGAPASR